MSTGMWTIPKVAFVGLTVDAAESPPHNLEVSFGLTLRLT